MEQQIPFSETKQTGSKKTLWLVVGVIVAIVVIAFFVNGGGLKGSYIPGYVASDLKVSVSDATFLKSGDLALTYTLENTGETITNKEFYILFKAFVNRVKTPTFIKPWNDQGVTELRKDEKLTYNTIIPQSMFPKEGYSSTDATAAGLPPSISPIKTVEVEIFAVNSQGSEKRLATSGEKLPTIEQ